MKPRKNNNIVGFALLSVLILFNFFAAHTAVALELPQPDANGLRNGYEKPMLVSGTDTCRSVTASTTTFSFIASSDHITRASGSFTADGMTDFQPLITVSGSNSNDGTYRVFDIQPTFISLFDDLTNELNASGVTITLTYDCKTVPTSANQTISTGASWGTINWSAGQVIAMANGDHTSKGTLNCEGSGTANNPIWIIHEDAVNAGVANGAGYTNSGSMPHPYNQSNAQRAILRGFNYTGSSNCNHVYLYGISVRPSSGAQAIRFPSTANTATHAIISNVYCDPSQSINTQRCLYHHDADSSDFTIQYTFFDQPLYAYDVDSDWLSFGNGVKTDNVRIINNEGSGGRFLWGGGTASPQGRYNAAVNNDWYRADTSYIDCQAGKNPTCDGGEPCTFQGIIDQSVFDPNGECGAGEGIVSMKNGGLNTDYPFIFAENRVWGHRPKPPDIGGTNSDWHPARCMSFASNSRNVLVWRNYCFDQGGGILHYFTAEPGGLGNYEIFENIIDSSQPAHKDPDQQFDNAAVVWGRDADSISWHRNLIIGNNDSQFVWWQRRHGSTPNEFKCNTIINGNARSSDPGSSLNANNNSYIIDTGSTIHLNESTRYENSDLASMRFTNFCFYRKLISASEQVCLQNVGHQFNSPSAWQNLCSNLSLSPGYGLR